jgi:hypothetical protein
MLAPMVVEFRLHWLSVHVESKSINSDGTHSSVVKHLQYSGSMHVGNGIVCAKVMVKPKELIGIRRKR